MFYAAHHIKLDTFVGRRDLARNVADAMVRGRSVLLRGGRRSGKTMFLRQTELAPPTNCIVIYVDKQELPSIERSDDFQARLVQLTAKAVRASVPSVPPLEALEQLIIGDIGSQGFAWCLLLDEVDSLAREPWGGSVLENLRHLVSNSAAAGRSSVVIAGGVNVVSALRSAGSSIANICRHESLKPLTDRDVAELAQLGPLRAAPAAEIVRELAGGHPFLAQCVLEEIEATGSYSAEEVRQSVAEDVAGWLRLTLGDLTDAAASALAIAPIGPTRLRDVDGELVASGMAQERDGRIVPNGKIIEEVIREGAPPTFGVSKATRLEPGRPYTNSRVFRDILEEAGDSVRWFDNYGGSEILDALADAEIRASVVRVLSGAENVAGRRFQRRLTQLAKELAGRSLALEWRVATDRDLNQTHDRFLLVDDRCYNVPPLTAVRAQKRADVSGGSMSVAEFDAIFARGYDVRRFSGAQA